MLPDDLAQTTTEQLYQWKDDLAEYRRTDGRGRSESAAYVRQYRKDERARLNTELRRRGLPLTAPDDTRTYGPGTAPWQQAQGARQQ